MVYYLIAASDFYQIYTSTPACPNKHSRKFRAHFPYRVLWQNRMKKRFQCFFVTGPITTARSRVAIGGSVIHVRSVELGVRNFDTIRVQHLIVHYRKNPFIQKWL
jgi:hypothetical protein